MQSNSHESDKRVGLRDSTLGGLVYTYRRISSVTPQIINTKHSPVGRGLFTDESQTSHILWVTQHLCGDYIVLYILYIVGD